MGSHHIKGLSTYNLSSFHIESKTPISFHVLLDYVFGIEYFLMIVMGRNVNLTSMSTTFSKGNSKDVYLPVIKKNSHGNEFEHFFNLLFLKNNYLQTLVNWFDFYFRNKYLLKLFFKTFETNVVDTLDFYVYASLLEGYYKLKFHGEDKYSKRISKVLRDIFPNTFSNLDDFISDVSFMRHNIFHLNMRDQLDEDLLHKITHDLFFLIRIILLRHIGLNVTIDTNPHMKNLVYLKRVN